jgi:MFS family permease
MKFLKRLRERNELVSAIFALRGNARAAIFTEPLWGIPQNLIAPFATLYMYSLGVNDLQIGYIVTLGMATQIITAMLGGVITDKFGRRRSLAIGDFVAWVVPYFMWAVAQNVWWFVAAAILHSLMQMSDSAWSCLVIEDSESRQMINFWSLVQVAGLLAVFFAPVSATLVARYDFLSVIRGLYFSAGIIMAAKVFILYRHSRETETGMRRMAETKGQSVFAVLLGYRGVFLKIVRNPAMRLILIVTVINRIYMIPGGSFFGLYITQNLRIDQRYLAIFPMVRAAVMMLIFFVFQNAINRIPFKTAYLIGIGCYIINLSVLLTLPPGMLYPFFFYIILEAVAFALLFSRRMSLAAWFTEPKDRARINSLMMILVLGVTAPFGSLIGFLSSVDRRLPFMLNFIWFGVTALIVIFSKTFTLAGKIQRGEADPPGMPKEGQE